MPDSKKVKATQHPQINIYQFVAFLVPPAGVILAVVLLTKDSELDKKAGASVFGVSIISFILWGFIGLLLVPSLLFFGL